MKKDECLQLINSSVTIYIIRTSLARVVCLAQIIYQTDMIIIESGFVTFLDDVIYIVCMCRNKRTMRVKTPSLDWYSTNQNQGLQ